MLHPFSFVVAILIGFLSLIAPVAAQPLEKLRLAYSAIAGSQASFWIPYEAGVFRKHGLDVELLYVGGGGRAAQVVQSGEVPIGTFTGGAVVNANLAGGDLVIIASSLNVFTFVVMAKPEIRGVEDLKGKKIGISRFGSATDFGLRFAESQWPIKRQRDFAVIQIGGVTDILAALRTGAVDAGVINAELAILARRDGFRDVADISKMGLSFPTSSIVSTRSYIKRNENTVRKFIRAYAEGVHFAKTQRAFSVQVMSKYMRNNDVRVGQRSLRFVHRAEYPEDTAANAGADKNRPRPNSRNRPTRRQSQTGTVYRRTVFRGAGEGRVFAKTVEVKR